MSRKLISLSSQLVFSLWQYTIADWIGSPKILNLTEMQSWNEKKLSMKRITIIMGAQLPMLPNGSSGSLSHTILLVSEHVSPPLATELQGEQHLGILVR